MSTSKFVNLITGLKNGSFVTVEKVSEHDMAKTGNPLRDAKVEKSSTFQVQVGCDLQRIEDNRAKLEGREPRTVGPLPWGEYLADGIPVIKHKGSLYLRGYWVKSLDSSYTVNGKPATPEQIAIIKQFSKNRPMEKTAPLCVKFDGIKRLAGGGQEVTA